MRAPIDWDTVPPQLKLLGRYVYALLVNMFFGMLLELTLSVDRNNGWEAWRRVCASSRNHVRRVRSLRSWNDYRNRNLVTTQTSTVTGLVGSEISRTARGYSVPFPCRNRSR